MRVLLGPAQSTAVMTVANRGDDDALIQLSVLAWSQSPDGGDDLTPTRDVLGNPGVFMLKAGAQQVARFALRVGQSGTERSYRIVVQEVPRRNNPNSVTTILRLLVPIFVVPPNPTVAIAWDMERGPDGMTVTAHNRGNVHVQIKSITLSDEHGASQPKPLSVYVLPGGTRAIRVPLAKTELSGKTIRLAAVTDQGGLSAGDRVEAASGAAGP